MLLRSVGIGVIPVDSSGHTFVATFSLHMHVYSSSLQLPVHYTIMLQLYRLILPFSSGVIHVIETALLTFEFSAALREDMVQSGTIYARLYGMCNVEADKRLLQNFILNLLYVQVRKVVPLP